MWSMALMIACELPFPLKPSENTGDVFKKYAFQFTKEPFFLTSSIPLEMQPIHYKDTKTRKTAGFLQFFPFLLRPLLFA